MNNKSGATCEDCRHKKVCVVVDCLGAAIHDDGALEAAVSEYLLWPAIADVEKVRDDLYREIDLALQRAFGKACPHYSREPEGEKIKVEELKKYLGDIKVDVPDGVLKSLNRSARQEVLDYATAEMLFQEDSEKYERPVFIPAVLLPYIAMGAAKEADSG